MLYDEFVKGTGCRENEYNFNVYKKLEIIYMQTDMSKEEIYEWGKKLVNNERSDEEKRIIEDWKAELARYKVEAHDLRGDIAYYKDCLANESDDYWKREYRNAIKAKRAWLKRANVRIREMQWLLKNA